VKKVLGLIVLFLFAFGLAACGQQTTLQQDPDTLVVQFVPSTAVDSALLTKVMSIETMLEDKLLAAGFDMNVSISIGTSYASVIEAMASGQVHVAFLTEVFNVLVKNYFHLQAPQSLIFAVASGSWIDDVFIKHSRA